MAKGWTKLTPEVADKFVKLLEEGHYRKVACAAVGISYQAFLNWLAKGEEGDAEIRLRRLKRADSPLSEILAEKDRWYSLRSERVRTLNALLLAVNEYRYANKSAEEA